MIVLTLLEAQRARGLSPSDSHSGIDPIPLKDGTFMLGENVLRDPKHADIHDFLLARSGRAVSADNIYQDGEAAVNPFSAQALTVRSL